MNASIRNNLVRIGLCAALLISTLPALSTHAQTPEPDRIWTAAASTGVADETPANAFVFTNARATLAPAIVTPDNSLNLPTLRYNVVAVDGLFGASTPTTMPQLWIRYQDSGPSARVRVRLYEYALQGAQAGTPVELVFFDSDNYPQGLGYQTRSITNCGAFSQFRFRSAGIIRLYYIEAQLNRTDSQGQPGLAGLAIDRSGACTIAGTPQ